MVILAIVWSHYMNLDSSFLSQIDCTERHKSARTILIRRYLDIDKWKNLSLLIDNFNPDVIILSHVKCQGFTRL